MMRAFLAILMLVFAMPVHAGVDIKEVTTPAGLKAWLVEDHTIPFVALELRFRGGGSLDLEGKRGATNLMVGLLEEGAADMDSRAFARATESLAANFRFNVSDDQISISAKFLTENRDAAVNLLRSSLLEPRFDADAIERVRAQITSMIRSSETDPGDLAGKAFDALVYADHPYGSSLEGTLESVAGLTREDLIAAHAAGLARDRVYISAVGDITEADLATLLDHLLGDLPATGAPLPPVAELNLPGGMEVVPFETPQSIAVFAQKGVDRSDPDFFAAYILNHILGGGGFESRLMTEVREKRGLTYGVYSYLVDKDAAQLWMGSVASANDRIAKAVALIRSEWERIRTEGVTPEELENAKTYLTGAYPLQFEGNAPIADIAVGMQMEGLPTDYITNRNDMVNAVTLEQINRVARERLDPETLTFVVVGAPEGLESSLN